MLMRTNIISKFQISKFQNVKFKMLKCLKLKKNNTFCVCTMLAISKPYESRVDVKKHVFWLVAKTRIRGRVDFAEVGVANWQPCFLKWVVFWISLPPRQKLHPRSDVPIFIRQNWLWSWKIVDVVSDWSHFSTKGEKYDLCKMRDVCLWYEFL